MRITPTAGPMPVTPVSSISTANPEARAKAIAMLTGEASSPQPTPEAKNQSQVTPEEMVGIRQQNGQSRSNVDTPQAAPPEPQAQAPEATPPEAPVEPQKTSPTIDERVKRQYDELARQQKALRSQQLKLKTQETSLQEREAKLSQPALTPEAPPEPSYTRADLKARALDILNEAGVTYEELTQQAINPAPKDPRYDTLLNENKRLNERLSQFEKNYQESQSAAEKAAMRQILVDVNSLVVADPEFETIKAYGRQKDVVELIRRTYDEEGEMMTVEEAAREVENYLVEEALSAFNKVDKIKKRIAANSPPQSTTTAAATPAKPAQPQKTQPMKTLTNATASTRKLSARDRAIAAFKGQQTG